LHAKYRTTESTVTEVKRLHIQSHVFVIPCIALSLSNDTNNLIISIFISLIVITKCMCPILHYCMSQHDCWGYQSIRLEHLIKSLSNQSHHFLIIYHIIGCTLELHGHTFLTMIMLISVSGDHIRTLCLKHSYCVWQEKHEKEAICSHKTKRVCQMYYTHYWIAS